MNVELFFRASGAQWLKFTIAVNFFDLFWADYFHIQRRTFLDEFLLAAVQFFNLAVHIGKQDGIGTGQCVLCGKKPK